ncbi:hypothetical protein GJR88_03039 [Dietzia sp. DQ12-45-1b]|nr:hypothetical protein GJR88_03039 [Dietzia sp. DQ12-45-1b]
MRAVSSPELAAIARGPPLVGSSGDPVSGDHGHGNRGRSRAPADCAPVPPAPPLGLRSPVTI